MSVALVGSVVTHQNNSTLTISVTVPTGANACVVLVSGANGESYAWPTPQTTPDLFSKLSFTNESFVRFTNIAYSYYDSGNPVILQALIMTASSAYWPGTGAKTLYWNRSGSSFAQGYSIAIAFFSNVDQANPIGNIQGRQGENVAGVNLNLTGVDPLDMGIILATGYDNTADPVPAGSGQTQICNLPILGYASLVAAYESSEEELVVGVADGLVGIAFSLKREWEGLRLNYRHGVTMAECQICGWYTYAYPFTAKKFIELRVQARKV
jgi:hypothetical protein